MDIDDENFQSKIYIKKEYNKRKIKKRKLLTDYIDIKKYRDDQCSGNFKLRPQQYLLSNYINPNTPYKGLLLYHGVGTGKCVLPDTYIYINDNVMKIKDIYYLYAKNNILNDNSYSLSDIKKGIFSIPKKELYVNSYDNVNNCITYGKVKYLFKQKIIENINVIILENGEILKITKNHHLMTENGWSNNFINNKYVLMPIKSIKTNSYHINYNKIYNYGIYISLNNNIRICDYVMNSSLESIIYLLKGIFDIKGYIDIKNNYIILSSSFILQINQIIYLLKLFEINVIKKNSNKLYYIIIKDYESIMNFKNIISFNYKKKKLL